jgi:TPR repeat protein
MYMSGQGVPRDYMQAYKWLNLAASQHSPGSDRDHSVRNRDLAAAQLTPAQIAEAQRLAREWQANRR